MASNQARLDQGEKNRQDGDGRSRGVRNVRVEEKKRINSYFQEEQLPNNASTDQIFNASYQKQGLQPQGLIAQATPSSDEEGEGEGESANRSLENPSRFSRRNKTPAQNTGRGWSRRQRNKPGTNPISTAIPQATAVSAIAKRGLARGRLTPVNSGIFLAGGNFWSIVQLPFALLCLASLGLYVATDSSVIQTAQEIGRTLSEYMPFSDFSFWAAEQVGIKPLTVSELGFALLAATTLIVHFIGIFTLLMLYITYRAALFKPLSGSGVVLKQLAFAAALLGYSLPLFNLAPWGLLVVWVVWLYPE